MLTRFSNSLVNILYLVPLKKRLFKSKYPNEKIIAAAGSKGIRLNKDSTVSRGLDWLVAKRAVLILTDKRLICGSWNIDLDKIVEAKALLIGSLSGKGLVLKIATSDGHHYQFGILSSSQWIEQEVLPLKIEEGKVEYSPFSVVLRVIIIVVLLWWLYLQTKS